MFSTEEREFLDRQRVAHFATADAAGQPHVVPVCFIVLDESLYFSIDEKPKRHSTSRLKRIRNIEVNSQVAIVVDRYDENWQRLAWVMMRGSATLLFGKDASQVDQSIVDESGVDDTSVVTHSDVQAQLVKRYPQLAVMRLDALPVVATKISNVTSWGNLSANGER